VPGRIAAAQHGPYLAAGLGLDKAAHHHGATVVAQQPAERCRAGVERLGGGRAEESVSGYLASASGSSEPASSMTGSGSGSSRGCQPARKSPSSTARVGFVLHEDGDVPAASARLFRSSKSRRCSLSCASLIFSGVSASDRRGREHRGCTNRRSEFPQSQSASITNKRCTNIARCRSVAVRFVEEAAEFAPIAARVWEGTSSG
jgi:hypothetical protein